MVNPYFNGQYYLTNNPDVAAAYGLSTAAAEQHYLNYGAGEALSGAAPSRKPAPWFDIKYYLDHNPDLVDAGLNANDLFTHFTTYGMLEGRRPSADIETITEAKLLAYAMGNEDLRDAFDIADDAAFLTPDQADALTQHFYQYGYKEGRPAPLFGSSEPDDGGQYFELTSGTDRMEGTAGDDQFDAFLAQNPMMGNISNTLTSADHLKGGAGYDSLFAELIAETPGTGASTLATQPRTTSIETVEIEARDFGVNHDFNYDVNVGLGLDIDLDRLEGAFGDDDWGYTGIDRPNPPHDQDDDDDGIIDIIDDVLDSITIGVGGSGNFNTGRGQAVLDAKHMYGIERIGSKNSDGHLKIQNLNTLMNDGETKRNTDAITITMDHTDNVNSIGEASDLIVYFDENYLISGEASEGKAFYWLLDQDSDMVGGPLLFHIDVDGIGFKIDGGETIVVASAAANAADNHVDFVAALNARLAVMIADGDAPAGTTIYLDPSNARTTALDDFSVSSPVPAIVVESGDGSPVTPIGYNKPADQTGEYNVWARFASEYDVEDQPISINIELNKVGRGGEGGDLIVGGKDVVDGKGIEVFNVTVMGDESKPSHVSALNSTANALRTVNVTTDENVTGEKGYADLTIDDLGGAYQNMGGRLVPETDVQNFDSTTFKGDLNLTTTFNQSGNGQHIYKLGAGDNTVNMTFDGFGGIAGDSLSLATGGGDDLIMIGGDADLESLTIDAGEGDNTIFFNADNFNLFTGGEGATIRSGSGSDAIYLNDNNSVRFPWTIRLDNDGHPNEFSPLDITGPTVQESYQLFGATMQVSVNGVQSQWVKIDYDKTAFTTSRVNLRDAFQDAINSNSALAGMVEIVELTDGTLAARSLVNGGSPVLVNIQGPVADKGNINNGLPLGNSGPVTATDGAGWEVLNGQSHLTQVSLSQMSQAWSAWYPGSSNGFTTGGNFGSDNGDFDGTTVDVTSASTLLTAMQTHANNLTGTLGTQVLNGTNTEAFGGNVINSGGGDDLIVLNRANGWDNTGNTVQMTEDYFGVNTIVNFDVTWSAGTLDDNDILDFFSYLDSAADARGISVGNQSARVDEAVPYSFTNDFVNDPGDTVIDHNSMHLWSFGDIWTDLDNAAAPGISGSANFKSFSATDLKNFFNGTNGPLNGEIDITDLQAGSGPNPTAQGNEFLIFVGKDGDVTADTNGVLSFDLAGTGTAADLGMFKVFEGKITQYDSNAGTYQVDFTERGTIDLAGVNIATLTAEEFGII